MELYIRSQDKMKLIRVIDLGIFEEQEGYTIYYDDNIDNMLGTYTTKERALEILDEIQRLINDLQYMSYAIPNNKFSSYRPNVYEMPEE